jgi:hypothetical protein
MTSREILREEQKLTREIEREEERRTRLRIRSSQMAGQAAARAAAEEIRANERASRSRSAAGGRFGGAVGGSIRGLVGSAAGFAGMALTVGGGFALANAARQQMESERTAALIVNAGTSGGVVPGTVGEAMGAARAASIQIGGQFSKEQLLGAGLKYAQSARGGDFAGVKANMGFFGKLAAVSGANIEDIAEAAGVLQSQNESLQGEKGAPAMQRMLLNVLAQSHAGSMSLVDSAKQIGTLGSTRAFFSQDEGKSQQTLIGMGQIARVGGDVGEAGTFVKDIASEVGIANRKYASKHGGANLVQMDANGRMTSPEDLVAQVFRGTKGNITEIGELFGKRGSTLFRELEKSYIQGAGPGGKNVEGGVQAVLGNMRQVTGATMSTGEFDQQFETKMSTPAAKIQQQFNKAAETLSEKLEPRLEHFATETLPKLEPVFEKAIDAADKFATWFAGNPLKGIGAIIGLAVTKDILAANIGPAIGRVLVKIITSQAIGGGVPGVGAAVTAGSIGKTALNVGTAALVVGSLLNPAGSKDTSAVIDQALGGDIANASPQDIAKRKASLVARQQFLQNTIEHPDGPLGETVTKAIGKPVAAASQAIGLDIFEAQLERVTAALKLLDDQVRQTQPPATPSPPVTSTAPTVPITDRPHT